jgi:GTPase SAR1 family protein
MADEFDLDSVESLKCMVIGDAAVGKTCTYNNNNNNNNNEWGMIPIHSTNTNTHKCTKYSQFFLVTPCTSPC